ncbi:hypothetical protein AB0G60_03085 [Streptomyces angustmyceticus]|uniref:Uncharacterized protein n=1 Tax=Streptomyces angustmyceticus TaxID=285578 RepID=A0A5J4L6L2_9ACTN|nr:hypothetical protein [Streptomyces angustmyceticus]UAL65645.1 hypothetical protein K7396_03045 [Streptomyces angustmyceticus]GES27832.1 hypothetical protein San01_03190 [Streptomyces angustmyceticus]
MNTPRAVDPNFAQSLADGLTESYEAWCDRIGETPAGQDATESAVEEVAP